jgi:hypothetical protein
MVAIHVSSSNANLIMLTKVTIKRNDVEHTYAGERLMPDNLT